MALFPPSEVKHPVQRRLGWVLFGFLFTLYIAYVIASVILALERRKHPVVSFDQQPEDVPLPDFFLCPEVTSTINHQYILGSFMAYCQVTEDNSVVGTRLNVTKGSPESTAPLNWVGAANRTTGSSKVTILQGSSCGVETFTFDRFGGDSILCFRYKMRGFVVKKDFFQDAGYASIGLSWLYGNAQQIHSSDPFYRVADAGATYADGYENLDSKTLVSFYVPGAFQISRVTLSLTRREYLNGTKATIGAYSTVTAPSSGLDDFPASDLHEVSLQLDKRGVTIIREKSTFDVTVIISQILAAWAFVMYAFGVVFTYDLERKFTLKGILRKVADRLGANESPQGPQTGTANMSEAIREPVASAGVTPASSAVSGGVQYNLVANPQWAGAAPTPDIYSPHPRRQDLPPGTQDLYR